MKKSFVLLFGALLLTGCNVQPVQEAPEQEIEEVPEPENEALPEWGNEILYIDHTMSNGMTNQNYVRFVDSEGNLYEYSLFSDDYDKTVYDGSWDAFENNQAGLMEVLYSIKDTIEPRATISSENLQNLCRYGAQLDSGAEWEELEAEMRYVCLYSRNKVYFHNPDTGALVHFYSKEEGVRNDAAANVAAPK